MLNISKFIDDMAAIDDMRSATVIGSPLAIDGLCYSAFVCHAAPPCGPVAICIGHLVEHGRVALDFIECFESAADAVPDLHRFGINSVEGAIVMGCDFEEEGTSIAAASLIVSLRSRKLH